MRSRSSASVSPERSGVFRSVPVEANRPRDDLSLRREADAAAAAAERLRDRGDEADLAVAVQEAPALRDLPPVVGLDGFDGELRPDRRDEVCGRHDLAALPAVEVAHVHEFDEAHDVPRALEMPHEVEHGVVVHAPLDDRVQLHRAEACPLGCRDASEHGLRRIASPVHDAEDLGVERIEADGDAPESGVAQRIYLLAEQVAVGGERQILDAGDAREHRHQRMDVPPHQRLAPGEPHLGHAEVNEQLREPRGLPRRRGWPSAGGSGNARRTPPRACSRCTGSCTGR